MALRGKRGKYRAMRANADLKTFVEEVINGSGDVSEWKQYEGGGTELKFTSKKRKDDL